MSLRRHPHAVFAVVFALATLVSLAPHLLILGYTAAGATPPGALLLFCPLHQLHDHADPALVLHAKPLA